MANLNAALADNLRLIELFEAKDGKLDAIRLSPVSEALGM